MNIKQLVISLYLKENIEKKEINEKLSIMINNVMQYDKELATLHLYHRKYKHYSYSTPITNEEYYQQGKIYKIYLNSKSENLLTRFKKALINYNNKSFVVCDVKYISKRIEIIKTIKTETPSVITINKVNLLDKDIMLMKERIIKNAIRKFNDYYNENIEENYNFISNIEILNKYPIGIKYKKGKIFGYKYRLIINTDELSQKIAELVLSSGVLEKNSLGLGFCKANS